MAPPSQLTLPLAGLKVIEFAGLAPVPYAGMVLADYGAQVIRIDKIDGKGGVVGPDVLGRGKRSVGINPKAPGGLAALKLLINQADVLIDPFRPGVLERLGLGPDVFLGSQGSNKRLIYARIVGFDRTGKFENMAGHDLNYLAQSGILSVSRKDELTTLDSAPSFPLNILADMAGGGLTCAMGIFLALIERNKSGKGQVVDNDMVSGARYVSAWPLMHAAIPGNALFGRPAGQNLLDGHAPFYSIYKCKDGRWMSLACIEAKFYATFLAHFVRSLPSYFKPPKEGYVPRPENQADASAWSDMREYFEAGFLTRTRDEWADTFYGTDACAIPVLSPAEAARVAGSPHPAPHPRLSRTPGILPQGSVTTIVPCEHTEEVLREIGLSEDELTLLEEGGAIRLSKPRTGAKL